MGRSRGLALVELLVTVVIIALLTALTMGAFPVARRRAREASCTSSLHQPYLALSLYRRGPRPKAPGVPGRAGALWHDHLPVGLGRPGHPRRLPRPHASLAESTPAHHYRPSRTVPPANLNAILAVEQSRRVGRDSAIAFRGKRLAAPPQYLGQHVWLQLLGDDLKISVNNQTIAQYSVANL